MSEYPKEIMSGWIGKYLFDVHQVSDDCYQTTVRTLDGTLVAGIGDLVSSEVFVWLSNYFEE